MTPQDRKAIAEMFASVAKGLHADNQQTVDNAADELEKQAAEFAKGGEQ